MKTQKIVEDNENNRAQKYPLYREVLILFTICDYGEQKKHDECLRRGGGGSWIEPINFGGSEVVITQTVY